MKIFASVAALLFAYSAFVQLNDPDPIRWILLYSCAAVLSAASIFVSIPRAIFIGLACVAGLWAATLAPGVVSDGSFTGTEEERELVGLLLVSSASAVLRRSGARASAGGV
ncbi:MAG: transmembrane 220 family protein [Myxococcota bacterium]